MPFFGQVLQCPRHSLDISQLHGGNVVTLLIATHITTFPRGLTIVNSVWILANDRLRTTVYRRPPSSRSMWGGSCGKVRSVLSSTSHTTDTYCPPTTPPLLITSQSLVEDLNARFCRPEGPYLPRSHGRGNHGWAVWAVQRAVNGRHRRVYNPDILMGSNSSDPAGYLDAQARPGRDGVFTICWDESLREDIVQASEVILLTADTDPPYDIPPAGDNNNVAPGQMTPLSILNLKRAPNLKRTLSLRRSIGVSPRTTTRAGVVIGPATGTCPCP